MLKSFYKKWTILESYWIDLSDFSPTLRFLISWRDHEKFIKWEAQLWLHMIVLQLDFVTY